MSEPTIQLNLTAAPISVVLGPCYNYRPSPDFMLLDTDEQELVRTVNDAFEAAENAIYADLV